jgi:thioesterase domain-containing protein
MAAEYLREVKARQPHGPYHFCGYSFGGLVAFEMARQLSESGDEIGLVGLFDTMMSPLRWPAHSGSRHYSPSLGSVHRRRKRNSGSQLARAASKMCSRLGKKLRGYPIATFLK